MALQVLGKAWGSVFTRTAEGAVGESGLGELISSLTSPPVIRRSCKSTCRSVEDSAVAVSVSLDVITGPRRVVSGVILESGQASLKTLINQKFRNSGLPKEHFFDSTMFFERRKDSLAAKLKIDL